MKITYDKEADAMYIYFKQGRIAKTIEVGKDFIADMDIKNSIIGLEILDASRKFKYSKQRPIITIGDKSFPFPALVH